MTFDGTDTTRITAADPLPPADDSTVHVRRLTRAESDEIDGSLCDLPLDDSRDGSALRLPER